MVVSDTMILSYLIEIHHEWIFQKMDYSVAIPPAVEAELKESPKHRDLTPYKLWLRVEQVKNRREVTRICMQTIKTPSGMERKMDLGEAECIVLVRELPGAELLISDDLVLHKLYHEELGRSLIRMGRLLIKAKEANAIPKVLPILRQLKAQTNYRITENAIQQIALAAGE